MSHHVAFETLLHYYRDQLGHTDEQIIIFGHWCFLKKKYLVDDNQQGTEFFNYKKEEDGSIPINYKKENVSLKTKHFFYGDKYVIKYLYLGKSHQSTFDYKEYLTSEGRLTNGDDLIGKIHKSIDNLFRSKRSKITTNKNQSTTEQKQTPTTHVGANTNCLEEEETYADANVDLNTYTEQERLTNGDDVIGKTHKSIDNSFRSKRSKITTSENQSTTEQKQTLITHVGADTNCLEEEEETYADANVDLNTYTEQENGYQLNTPQNIIDIDN